METVAKPRMTAEEFIKWSMDQPEGARYELTNGEIVAMASERLRHALVKAELFYRLRQAAEQGSLPCTVFTDGMAVRVDAATVYEPDVAIRCGNPLPDSITTYDDPVVVVEVSSSSTASVDMGDKLEDYFRLASVRHYLVVRTHRPAIIHHERMADGTIQTRIVAAGTLRMDPPGITVDVASLFP